MGISFASVQDIPEADQRHQWLQRPLAGLLLSLVLALRNDRKMESNGREAIVVHITR